MDTLCDYTLHDEKTLFFSDFFFEATGIVAENGETSALSSPAERWQISICVP